MFQGMHGDVATLNDRANELMLQVRAVGSLLGTPRKRILGFRGEILHSFYHVNSMHVFTISSRAVNGLAQVY